MSKSTKAQSLADINSTIDTCHKLLNVFKKRMNRENSMYRELQLIMYTLVFSTFCPLWHGQHCVRDQKYIH